MTLYLITGVVAGALLVAAAVAWTMRNFMIERIRMDAPFEVVCDNIERAIAKVGGWGHPLPDWDFHAAVARTHYFDNLKRKRIFFICKAEYANRIVDNYPHMGAMMPCAWAIYETNDGAVYVAKMNIGLMSKVFTGNIIGSTMGKVAREEHEMIAELRRLVRQPPATLAQAS